MLDKDLIEKIRRQDRDALDELFSQYMQKAFAVSFQLCGGNRDQAQDLTQEAMLKAIKNIQKFRGEASFSTWLYRIIYNTYLDSRKKQQRWMNIFSPWRWKKQKNDPDRNIPEEPRDMDRNNSPLQALQGSELGQAVQKAIRQIPENQRIVFQLKVFNEMTLKEIAKMMGSAEGTVKSHLFRATRSLQERLGEWA